MGRLEEIAYELKNLWSYLTRQELSEYYGVSERTLFTYSKKLNLPKRLIEMFKKRQVNQLSYGYIKIISM